MKIADLLREWESSARGPMAARDFTVQLTADDAARILALAAMYPQRSESQIINGLLSVALDEIERAMPYIQGTKVVAEDEQGNPVYEDVGPGPRFFSLAREFRAQLQERDSGIP